MAATDITPGLIARLTQAAHYVINGITPETWFGPMQPLEPLAPADVAGRRFDYPTGYNLSYTPRVFEGITFEEMRALADNCDILRSVIETRKDQMEALDWAVRVVPSNNLTARIDNPTSEQKMRIDQITAFLQCPDKEHSFEQWIRQILEDMFVIDAIALYKRRSKAGGLYALEIIDGATIKLLIDENGRPPANPDPAYQQVLKGVPAVDYTREELIYLKHNPRSNKIYGYSHVEQVMVTVNILIRRALHQLEYYRDGSQPDALVGLPSEWSKDLSTDTITNSANSAWTVSPSTASIVSSTVASSGTLTTVWIAGGIAGITYILKNTIISSAGREMSKTFRLLVSANNFS